ncbi:Tungstate ABC transporter, substrate-binding protein [hydrothermal vent metagenome]|uniref:Tungstate ABC transporter, substrate-binding protein n=1 Tax=hydrothermal vent metagenome TaxID=652676 RepID=A0A3B0T2L7_9ZZZZ
MQSDRGFLTKTIVLKTSTGFKIAAALALAGLVMAVHWPAAALRNYIVVQSTTSTQNSGLYDHLLPLYSAQSGVNVRIVAVGTGQAIKNAANCDGDVLLVHARAAEEAFVAKGLGVKRTNLMYNDFVIVGPRNDPADIGGMTAAATAMAKIAGAKVPFVSRGDGSGTHRAELALWRAAGVDAGAASGTWYRETGSGMGATLNIAAAMAAYVMTDRATWTTFGNKADLTIQVQGDVRLFNQYGVTLVNPDRCPNVKAKLGQDFIDWLLSAPGQSAIGAYKVDGKTLFFPNAPK